MWKYTEGVLPPLRPIQLQVFVTDGNTCSPSIINNPPGIGEVSSVSSVSHPDSASSPSSFIPWAVPFFFFFFFSASFSHSVYEDPGLGLDERLVKNGTSWPLTLQYWELVGGGARFLGWLFAGAALSITSER